MVGGYLYWCLDDEIRRQVQKRLTNHYTNLEVHVGRAHFEQHHGITVYDVTLSERTPGSPPLLSIEELHLAGDIRIEELAVDRLDVNEIQIRRVKVRAARNPDGKWNLASLLPVPAVSVTSPTIKIQDVALAIEDAGSPQIGSRTFKGIDLTLTPIPTSTPDSPSKSYQVAGNVAGLPAQAIRVEGEVSTSGEYDLAAQVSGLEVNSELIGWLPGVPAAHLQAIDVSGRADITLQLNRTAQQPPNWSAAFELRRGRVAHAGLPDPLTDLVITGRADTSRLQIARLACRCGPASVALSGERSGWAANAPLALAAKVVGLSVNDHSFEKLPKSCALIGARFQPAGIVDADIRATFDGQRWRPHVVATCRNMYLTDAEKFRYRLQQTNGTVEYRPTDAQRPDSLRLDLQGLAGSRPVRVEAELTHLTAAAAAPRPAGHARHPVGWVQVSGVDIPLHEQLLAALPDRAEQLVRSLRAQGAVDFRFRAQWSELSQPLANVTNDIRLKDCTIHCERFPYPLRHVQGLVTGRDGIWTLHDVEGRGWNESTVVVCRGDSSPRGNGYYTQLTFDAANVALDDNLKLALPPAAQQAWGEFRPEGRIDFTANAVCEPGEIEPRVEIDFRPRDRSVSIDPLMFPYRLDHIEGTASFAAGRFEFRNVIARHDHAVYSAASGAWQATPGGWQLQINGLNADRLTPHRDLIVALPPAMQRMFDRLQPAGTFGVYNSSLSLTRLTNSPDLLAAWDVNLDCHQAQLRGGIPVQNINGGVHLVGRIADQSVVTSGELALDSVIWNDIQLTDVRGPLWIDATACIFGDEAAKKQGRQPCRITADAYDGSLAANIEVQNAATPAYKIDLALGGANLARFANERLGGPSEMNGTVSGRLLLAGTANSKQSMQGRGELSVVDANIYELPVLVAMLKVLKVRAPDTTAFNRCDMQFAIQGEQIHFEKLNLLGDALSLYGKGESGFDRQLDLVFYTLLEPANLPIPFWKTIAGQVSQQTLQLKVVGTWEQAEVQPQTLPGFNQMLEQIQSSAATMAPSTAKREAMPLPR